MGAAANEALEEFAVFELVFSEFGTVDIGVVEVDLAEIRAHQVRSAQLSSRHVCAVHIHIRQGRVAQISRAEVGVFETTEIDAPQDFRTAGRSREELTMSVRFSDATSEISAIDEESSFWAEQLRERCTTNSTPPPATTVASGRANSSNVSPWKLLVSEHFTQVH